VAYGAGLRVSEIANLKVSDIDSKRMLLRVEQGKGKKDRYAMLATRTLSRKRNGAALRAGLGCTIPPRWRRSARPFARPGTKRTAFSASRPSTESQRAMVADKIANLKQGRPAEKAHVCASNG
jgi:integrase/recombinase XerD